ncbi:hypothetical protein HP456_16260, partial [Bacillus haikouensis]|nr:hypothetical protein [Bacillus haikouensis]
MNSIRKICFSLLAALLIFSNFAGFAQAETSEASNVSDVVVSSESGEVIHLYKEPSEASEVLTELPNTSKVTLLPDNEVGSSFTSVSYYDSETDAEIEGYVLSEFITVQGLPEDGETNQDDKTQEEELNSDQSSDTDDSIHEEGVSSEEENPQPADDVVTEEDTISDKTSTDAEESEQPLESDEQDGLQTETTDEGSGDTAEIEEKSKQAKTFSTFSTSTKEVGGETFKGVALKSPTHVYEAQSSTSKKLKSYAQGSILIYQALNSNWYIATVYINGKATTGYIAINDVENISAKQTSMKGIGMKSPTNIYTKASDQSSVIKSYDQGSQLYYKTFTSGWYECLVYVNGKATSGYIKVTDVENLDGKQVSLKGVAKQSTPIYKAPSSNSGAWKSYPAGSVLVYKTLIDGWYEARIYANGGWRTGYINAAHVSNVSGEQVSLKGVSVQTTPIYRGVSTSSGTWKSYPTGSVLVYNTFIDGWYEARIYADGAWRTGYINAANVKNVTDEQVRLKGVAKQSTPIYKEVSTSSGTWKSYPAGSVLVYDTFIDGWYEARVYADGGWRSGYIHASHVENSVKEQESLKGIGQQSPTKIYADASNSASVLKSYAEGTILYYTTFVGGWYEAVVYVNGKKMNGYIDASHVENIIDRQDDLEGISLKSPTNVYSLASKGSRVLKNYTKGSVLNFKTFSASWYEAVVYIEGVRHVGYIHKNDIQTLGTDVIQDNTSYGMTFDEMLDLQMKNNPQTDLYRNEPAYIWAEYVDMSTWKVTDDDVNVRSSPTTSTSSNIVSEVNEGDWVKVIKKEGNWV